MTKRWMVIGATVVCVGFAGLVVVLAQTTFSPRKPPALSVEDYIEIQQLVVGSPGTELEFAL